jgi:probable phosphoglycerate mutase
VLTIGQSTVAAVEIVLIRHGQPEWVRDGRSVVNPPLTALGHEQAQLLADGLPDHFDEVLVSPLERARQTAIPVFAKFGRDEAIEPWLEEIRDPEWHGEPAEVAQDSYREFRDRSAERRWDGFVGGESVRNFTDRIHTGARSFLFDRGVARLDHPLPMWSIETPDRKICLIAHAGTNAVTIAYLLGLEPTPWEWDRFSLGHASVTRVAAVRVQNAYTFAIRQLSNLEHIPSDKRTH